MVSATDSHASCGQGASTAHRCAVVSCHVRHHDVVFGVSGVVVVLVVIDFFPFLTEREAVGPLTWKIVRVVAVWWNGLFVIDFVEWDALIVSDLVHVRPGRADAVVGPRDEPFVGFVLILFRAIVSFSKQMFHDVASHLVLITWSVAREQHDAAQQKATSQISPIIVICQPALGLVQSYAENA